MAYYTPSTLVLLSSQTASSSASIVFTSKISTSYTSYLLTLRDIVVATNNNALLLTMSTDNGSTYLASTGYKYEIRVIKSANTAANINSTGTSSCQISPSLSSTTAKSYNADLQFFAMDQATFSPRFGGWGINQDDTSSDFFTSQIIGMNTTTTAVNAIKIISASGNITSGTFNLYGVLEP